VNRALIFILLLASSRLFAQAVVFVEINDTVQKPKYQEFVFLNDNTDISGAVRVATLKAIGSQDDPVLLYNLIKDQAQKVGANSFRLAKIDKFPDQTAELMLETFYANDSILGVNFNNIEKNNAYLFGDLNFLETRTQSCKVNGEKYDLKAGHYLKFAVMPGENLKIAKGGITGTSLTVQGESGKPSKFYCLKGFQITGASGSANHVGVNFSSGDIGHVDQDLALLLTRIFEEQH